MMPPPIVIRPATPADAAIIAEYNRRLALETEHKTLDPATLAAGVAAVFADPARGFYTVADQAGQVVGQTLITFEWSDWRNGWYWWLQSVYVAETHRGAGLFRRLFDHLKTQATADPAVIGLRLYVEHDNARARAIYAQCGLDAEPYSLMGLYPLPGRAAHIS
jgi:GNAT superfamily N-acetyltransferase